MPPFRSDYTMTFHNHDGYEIFLMLEGECLLSIRKLLRRNETRRSVLYSSPRIPSRPSLLTTRPIAGVVINFRSHIIPGFSSGQTDLDSIFNRVAPTEINFVHLDSEELALFFPSPVQWRMPSTPALLAVIFYWKPLVNNSL